MIRSTKQYEVLQWAFSFLKKHGREEAVAEILLQHHLNVSRAHFFASMQEEIDAEIVEVFKQDVIAHANTGIPVQHLTEEAEFYGRSFFVNKDVLIPRFETEELVHYVIELVRTTYGEEPITIVDVGTGSGVIAITLALELANAHIYATDISGSALQIAEKNALAHNAPVQFSQGDLLQPVIDHDVSPQIIVSNPPYIKKTDIDQLSDTVKNFDPHVALFADKDGLLVYEKLIYQVTTLKEQADFLVVEIGFDQAKDVENMINKQCPNSNVCIMKDMNGKDRIVAAKL